MRQLVFLKGEQKQIISLQASILSTTPPHLLLKTVFFNCWQIFTLFSFKNKKLLFVLKIISAQ